jgi:hypothetical protein
MNVVSRARAARASSAVAILVAAALVAGCSSNAGASSEGASSASASSTSLPTPTATATESQAASASLQPTGLPTSLDPCALVTQSEAATLTGVTFAAGQEQTTSGNGKLCMYGAEGNVLQVVVGIAADSAAAAAGKEAFKTDLEKAAGFGVTLNELPGFAPNTDAATVEASQAISGVSISISAIYVLRGTTFFAISDVATLGAKAPSSVALQAQAKVTLTRLP